MILASFQSNFSEADPFKAVYKSQNEESDVEQIRFSRHRFCNSDFKLWTTVDTQAPVVRGSSRHFKQLK